MIETDRRINSHGVVSIDPVGEFVVFTLISLNPESASSPKTEKCFGRRIRQQDFPAANRLAAEVVVAGTFPPPL
jgi:hypothetical protein